MSTAWRSRLAAWLVVTALGVRPACAQVDHCGGDIPDSYVGVFTVEFHRVYTGAYRNGQPYDYVTIDPAGTGETLEDMGITIRVQLTCERSGSIVVGMPAADLILFNSHLCLCGYKTADRATDANGETTFSGTIAGGGCADQLTLFADGMAVGSIPVKINSPDSGSGFGDCIVDGSDLSALATHLGHAQDYSICFDYNESGGIDAGDLSFFAQALGSRCP